MPLVTMQLFGKRTNSLDAAKLIAKLYPKISLILVTQGEKGSFCYDCQAHRVYECKAEPASVVSTVGAGDSFGATFLAWYLKTQDIMLSMNLASKVSAFVVSYQEAIPADTKEFIKNVVPI
jgi:sugar/nucleoside kinase (ribokinase family)